MRLNYKDCGKIGFTCSTFDLLHAGHITMLEQAKHHCDYLIVGLQTDPTVDRPDSKNAPIQTIVERQIQLAADKYIDDGEALKAGNASTVAEVTLNNSDYVLKRYNLKSAWHSMIYFFKTSRASKSWQNAQILNMIGQPISNKLTKRFRMFRND